MPYGQGRVYATIEVDGTEYAHILASATPPSPTWNVGTSAAAKGMDYPLHFRFNPLNFTFSVEGDYYELNNMVDPFTVIYTETLQTRNPATGALDTKEVTYEVTGIQTVEPQEYTATNTGFPLVQHTLNCTKFKKVFDGQEEWDVDIDVYPPKFNHMGKPAIPGAVISGV